MSNQTDVTQASKKKKRKWPIVVGAIVVIVALFVLFGGGGASVDDGSSFSAENLLEDNGKLFSNPGDCIGKSVDIYGQIFNEVQSDGSGTYFQMYTDIENYEKDVMVYVADGYKAETEKNVHVQGVVTDTYTGENLMGGEITCAVISAKSVEDATYEEAFAPALKTTESNASLTVGNVKITVNKVEFAENETRLHVTVNNNSSDSAEVYPYSSAIVQDGKQYDYEENYTAGYKTIPDAVQAGANVSGIMTYPAIEQSDFKLIVSVYVGDNYYDGKTMEIGVD